MTKPTPRSELVKAVAISWGIVAEALPIERGDSEAAQRAAVTLQAAALPVILREVLDVEIVDDEHKDDR